MTRKAQAPGLGPLDDPLANWPNDDLLLEGKSRNRIARDYPDLLKILDWPELRAAFEACPASVGIGVFLDLS